MLAQQLIRLPVKSSILIEQQLWPDRTLNEQVNGNGCQEACHDCVERQANSCKSTGNVIDLERSRRADAMRSEAN